MNIYIASRVHHAVRWRGLRNKGVPIISSWIDCAGEGESGDYGIHWQNIVSEIENHTDFLILYAETSDFPLKGAFVEVGVALASGVPVLCVLPGVVLEPRSYRPVGSWMNHPLVAQCRDIHTAICVAEGRNHED